LLSQAKSFAAASLNRKRVGTLVALFRDGKEKKMADLLLRDLVMATGGRVSLAAMPPRDGDLLMLRRSTPDAAEVRPGDLFWALSGLNDDGMRHVEEAFSRGAAGAVISGRAIEPWPGKFTLSVDDVRSALWRTAIHARMRLEGTVIVVSGPGAVMTTATAIHRVLGSQLSGSLAAPACGFATCLTSDLPAIGLLNAHPSHDYLVLAVAGPDVDEVAHRCAPHACVITGGEAGVGFAEMLASLPETGWAILPGDDAELRATMQEAANSVRAIWYGRSEQNDLHDGRLPVTALPAVALAKILNISDLSVSAALGNVPPAKGQPAPVRMPIATASDWSLVIGH
jgi:UDP-N-acetylmuramyl pentapeptide synthase